MKTLVRAAIASMLAAGSLVPSQVFGQDAVKPDRVEFKTVDRVELRGLFYPADKNSPVVLIVPKTGDKGVTKAWTDFAEALSKKKYAVLLFDFRGHGRSTNVNPKEFWSIPYNRQYVRGFKAAVALDKQPNQIDFKDFGTSYYPYLVNDLVAAKTYLEVRNDANDCNVSNLIVIAEEEGALLASMWAAAECYRHRFTQMALRAPEIETEAQVEDIIGMVWLSPHFVLAKKPYGSQLLLYNQLLGGERKIPTAILYGGDDGDGEKITASLLKKIRREHKQPFKVTGEHVVKKTDLKGSKLLVDSLTGRKWVIEEYLDRAIREARANNPWQKREADQKGFLWEFYPGRRAVAKTPGESYVRPFPVTDLLSGRVNVKNR